MPGVISAMAKVVTGDPEDTATLYKMMEEGKIDSKKYMYDFAAELDRLARQGGAYGEAISQAAAEQMRMNNQWNDWLRILESKGFEEGQANVFRTMATFMERLNPLIEMFAENWGFLAQVVRIPLGILGDFTELLPRMSRNLGITEGAIVGITAAGAAMMFPFTRMILLFGVLFALFEDFTAFLTGRDSMFGKLLGDDEEETRKNFLNVYERLGETLKAVGNIFSELIGNLSDDPDITWVDRLNEGLKYTEELMIGLNMLLGGKSKKLIELEKEVAALDKQENVPASKLISLHNQMKIEKERSHMSKIGEVLYRGMGGSDDRTIRQNVSEDLRDDFPMVRDTIEFLKNGLQMEMPSFLRDESERQGGMQNPQSSAQPIEQRNEITIRLEGSGSTEEDAQEIVAQINNAAIRFAGGVA